MEQKNIFLGIFAAIGGIFSQLVGGFDKMLYILIIFMVTDYISGMLVALVFRKSTKTKGGGASSSVGFKGIVKKICMLMLVVIGAQVDKAMGTSCMRYMVICFFVGNEGLSILENATLMGIPLPEKLKTALEILKNNDDKEGYNG